VDGSGWQPVLRGGSVSATIDGGGLEEIMTSSSSARGRCGGSCGPAASPIELVTTRRLLLAKQLLTETSLSVSEIAYASGFASLRRFNGAFVEHYGMPPTRLRREAVAGGGGSASDGGLLALRLAYRPPLDWRALLSFLGQRALRGVECITGDCYLRTARLGQHTGWLRVGPAPTGAALLVELTPSLAPVLPALLGRLRDLFDLDARPDVIARNLGQDPLLAAAVTRHPGLRVPGAFDGFELGMRAILGQQITVAAATTIAGRVVERFGDAIDTPHPGLNRLTPAAERLAGASVAELGALGVISARGRSILALAGEVAAGRVRLSPGADPEATCGRLLALPGIGPWTAQSSPCARSAGRTPSRAGTPPCASGSAV
jgi:AraC family transcriptional regulator of adaptative response / DNA-3-methyladenine glycosylase II